MQTFSITKTLKIFKDIGSCFISYSILTDALSQQIERCERFETGYDLFLKAEWQKAVDQFRAILTNYLDDGPSEFYFSECQQRIKVESLPENPFVILRTKK